jgi:hypothetical protein
MAMIDEVLEHFARAIFFKARALKSPELGPNQKKRLRKSINEDIRHCGGLIFPDMKPYGVSTAAHEEATRLNVKDICTQTWHTQTRFDAGRRTFHLEHVFPVISIMKECMSENSHEAVLRILQSRLRVAWILKKEDRELTRLGYRSKRPDPDSAYEQAGIQLLKSKDRA